MTTLGSERLRSKVSKVSKALHRKVILLPVGGASIFRCQVNQAASGVGRVAPPTERTTSRCLVWM